MKFVVAQLGARMHYAVPRILNKAGMLERLYTDVCASNGWPQVFRYLPQSLLSPALRRLAGRIPHGVPTHLISSFPLFGIAYAGSHLKTSSVAEAIRIEMEAGHRLCELAIDGGFGAATAVYTFNSAGLELQRAARKRGLRTVLEQTIAPYGVERSILEAEEQRLPGWSDAPRDREMEVAFADREAAEWELADVIICGSDFVREGIRSLGGPADRCVVVPYGVDGGGPVATKANRTTGRKLCVLTVGAIGLRKGSYYALSAAKDLATSVHFRMVGSLQVPRDVEVQLRRHIEILGPVPRSEIEQHYAWADVLLLPSLCEGSATVVYEALAAGIPVVCTPNTGSIVRDGLDGFIVPICDVEAITDALTKLASNHSLLIEMRRNALARASEYTLDRYGERLINAVVTGCGSL
jgi:glycosyltransferase involved in cell wall biosynthesis